MVAGPGTEELEKIAFDCCCSVPHSAVTRSGRAVGNPVAQPAAELRAVLAGDQLRHMSRPSWSSCGCCGRMSVVRAAAVGDLRPWEGAEWRCCPNHHPAAARGSPARC